MKTYFPRVRPEDVGISPKVIKDFIKIINESGYWIEGVMLLRYGKLVFQALWEPFTPSTYHCLQSCTKSFTATAVGFALAEGLFSLNDRIIDLLPEKVEGVAHPYIAAMTVEHLLKMATAYSIFEDPESDDWTHEFLNSIPDHYPGTVFGYDTTGTHVLCELVQKFSHQTLHEYLQKRLFAPLDIEELDWELSPTGVNRGGGGIYTTMEAMAKFGQLYLQDGMWEGQRILPEGWVETAVSFHIDNSNAPGLREGNNGYGYQFWRIKKDTFCCLGMGGQIITVIPEKEVVFVATANAIRGSNQYYIPHGYLFSLLLPAFQESPILYQEADYQSMCRELSDLQMYLPKGKSKSPLLPIINHVFFPVEQNSIGIKGFQLDFEENTGRLLLFYTSYSNFENEKHTMMELSFGMGKHLNGKIPFQRFISQNQYFGRFSIPGKPAPLLRDLCGSGASWSDERTLVIHSHLTDNLEQSFVITCNFGKKANVIQIYPFGDISYDGLPCILTHLKQD